MRPSSRPAAKKRSRGFSLLELVVCVAIIGIMTVALVRVYSRVDQTRVVSVGETARRINEIATTVHAMTGQWPAEVDHGVVPPEIEPYFSNRIFTNATQLGGQWDWNGPGGATGDSPGIAIRFKSSSDVDYSLLKKLDSLIDDGDLSAGECVWMSTNGGAFYMMGANDSPSMKTESLPSMKAESVETFGLPIKMKEMTMSEAATISSEDLVK
jgi:prepilin-type N-terminal cleavage/methylation domain-containing protein